MKRKSLFIVVLFLAAFQVISGTTCRKKQDPGSALAQAGGEEAVNALDETGTEAEIEPAPKGRIEIKGADFAGHEVRNAATGEKAGVINSQKSTAELPPGVYEVVFGRMVWKNVEVKEDVTTILVPGGISVKQAALQGHDVVEVGTGTVQGSVSSLKNTLTLIPGKYAVMFGKLSWPVEVQPGVTVTLNPGTVEVVNADVAGHKIFDKTGDVVGEVSSIQSSIPLPPGDYEIDIDGSRVPFTLREGDSRKFERQG